MTCEDKGWDIFPDNENNMCNFIDFLMQREKKNMHTTNFYGEQCKTVGRNIMKQSSSALTNLCIILKEVSRDEVKQWRTNKVHSVLKTWGRREADRISSQFIDKALLASKDYEPNLKEILDVIGACWEQGTTWGAAFRGLREACSILLGLSNYMRGDSQRLVLLSDFAAIYTNEKLGPTPAETLKIMTSRGKKNKNGRINYAGAMRHKDPRQCFLTALSFFLLLRFDFQTSKEYNGLDLSDARKWYNIALLPG